MTLCLKIKDLNCNWHVTGFFYLEFKLIHNFSFPFQFQFLSPFFKRQCFNLIIIISCCQDNWQQDLQFKVKACSCTLLLVIISLHQWFICSQRPKGEWLASKLPSLTFSLKSIFKGEEGAWSMCNLLPSTVSKSLSSACYQAFSHTFSTIWSLL